MKSRRPKSSPKNIIISLIIASPFMAFLWFLVAYSIFPPFFPAGLAELEIKTLIWISAVLIILVIWYAAIKNLAKDSRFDNVHIPQVAHIMKENFLSFQESVLINSTEGWSYKTYSGIQLENDHLKVAYQYAYSEKVRELNLKKVRSFIAFGLSIIMALFGFYGSLEAKGGELPPPVGGIFCLIASFIFLYCYLKNKNQLDHYQNNYSEPKGTTSS
jgi:hypothetical protein